MDNKLKNTIILSGLDNINIHEHSFAKIRRGGFTTITDNGIIDLIANKPEKIVGTIGHIDYGKTTTTSIFSDECLDIKNIEPEYFEFKNYRLLDDIRLTNIYKTKTYFPNDIRNLENKISKRRAKNKVSRKARKRRK